MNFKGLMISILLIGLVSFGLISFVINFQENLSGDNSTILQNSALNNTYENVRDTLDSAEQTAKNVKNATDQDTPTLTAGFFLLSSIINGAKTFGGIVVNIYDSTFGLIASVFGISPVVVGVFVAIILIIMVISAYSLYKQGDNE